MSWLLNQLRLTWSIRIKNYWMFYNLYVQSICHLLICFKKLNYCDWFSFWYLHISGQIYFLSREVFRGIIVSIIYCIGYIFILWWLSIFDFYACLWFCCCLFRMESSFWFGNLFFKCIYWYEPCVLSFLLLLDCLIICVCAFQ